MKRNEEAKTKDPYEFLETYEKPLSTVRLETKEDERHQWFLFLDMLCLISIYQREERPEELFDRIGAIPGDAALMGSLEPGDTGVFPGFDRVRGIYEDLMEGESLDGGEDLPIAAILSRGGLSHLEFLAFLMAFAFSMNRKYQRIFGILTGEKETDATPSIGLCCDFARLYLLDEEREVSSLFSPDSFLNRFLLFRPEGGKERSALASPLILKPSALSAALGEKEVLGDLPLIGEKLTPASDTDFVSAPDKTRELYRAYSAILASGKGGAIELSGEEGSGRRFLLRLLSADFLVPVFSVDLRKVQLLSGERQRLLAGELVLKGVLNGAVIYLHHATEQRGELSATYFLSELKASLPLLVLGTKTPLSEEAAGTLSGALYRIRVGEISYEAQLSLWTSFARADGIRFPEELDLSELVSRYVLTPGRIREALTNAARQGERREGGVFITREVLEEQIRRICSVQFKETATRLSSPFTFSDLKVDQNAEKLLRYVIDRVRYRKKVNEDFGFGKKLPYGKGVSVVLYGPPGTGKTMAAQVLSKELGLDIYRIDLSQISSKYIGETEKNLGAVFDAAKNSNAVLFFDEADALFSKRTEVSSSHDRYANAETSYLLQKIEEYQGVSILATNNMQNFDAAFKRRITYIIPIEEPSEETRLLLWQNAFPERVPLSSEIDFRILSRALAITGSNIKSVALNAAYRAAAEDRSVNWQDLIEAVDAECRKTGRMGVGTELQQAIIRGYREEETNPEDGSFV